MKTILYIAIRAYRKHNLQRRVPLKQIMQQRLPLTQNVINRQVFFNKTGGRLTMAIPHHKTVGQQAINPTRTERDEQYAPGGQTARRLKHTLHYIMQALAARWCRKLRGVQPTMPQAVASLKKIRCKRFPGIQSGRNINQQLQCTSYTARIIQYAKRINQHGPTRLMHPQPDVLGKTRTNGSHIVAHSERQ